LVPVAGRSKAFAGIPSPVEIVSSNPAGGIRGMDVFMCKCRGIVRQRSLRRTDHSSRGVLPTVVRRFEWSINLKTVEAMAHFGPQSHKKKTQL